MKNNFYVFWSQSHWFCIVILIVIFCFIFSASVEGQSNNRLTGTVSIRGIPQVDQTLTADVSSLGGSGIIYFQWMRDGTTLIGTDNPAYTVQNADEYLSITVTVRRSDNSGSITSAPVNITRDMVVWSFTDELDSMLHNYYMPAHPSVLSETKIMM